jgi:TonB C terminal
VHRGSIEIAIYAAPQRVPRIPSRVVTVVVGAAVSLAFHALIFTGALWGAGSSASRPPIRLADATSDTPDQDEAAMQWISLDTSATAERVDKQIEAPAIDLAATRLSADALAALSAAPEIVLDSPDRDSPQHSADDLENRSALYGRYIGQINARVFRAWLRPRTPIGSPSFSCRAHINQDTRGNVKEVKLEACNGDARWQLSVVHAIKSSSPLPAPPDPRVFRHDVTVSFQSLGYRASVSSEDEFESPVAQLAGTGATKRQNNGASVTSSRDGIALRIVGHAEPTQIAPIEPEPSRNAIEAQEVSDER